MLKELLEELACHLRAMQLYYHSAHHHVSGANFFADHQAFAAFYAEVELQYDGVVERLLGLFGPDVADLHAIVAKVVDILKDVPGKGTPENKELYGAAMGLEESLLAVVEKICKEKGLSESDKQLVSDIGNLAAVRVYKIKQRLG